MKNDRPSFAYIYMYVMYTNYIHKPYRSSCNFSATTTSLMTKMKHYSLELHFSRKKADYSFYLDYLSVKSREYIKEMKKCVNDWAWWIESIIVGLISPLSNIEYKICDSHHFWIKRQEKMRLFWKVKLVLNLGYSKSCY